MRAIIYTDYGSADVLTMAERPVPEPGPGQVLIQVAAASVNPIDRRLRSGELKHFFKQTFPTTPGWDVSGRIAKVAPDVTGWNVGDAVAALAFTWHVHHGAYAEYIPVNASAVAAIPSGLSFIEAAALPLAGLTAMQSLTENASLTRGQSVFVQAGAGGLGSALITLARHLGAKVYTTTKEKNFDYVRSLGADVLIDYTRENYVHVLKRHEPKGLDAVFELLDDFHYQQNAIRICKTGGAVVYMNNEPPEMPDIANRNIRAEWIHHRPDGKMLSELLALYASGQAKMPHIEVMPLELAIEAHRLSESRTSRGKLVLKVQDL